MEISYQSGFGNHHQSEAIADTLPQGQNSPQQCAHGLYAEQLSGTAFTAPRAVNARSWLYRIQPSVCHEPFQALLHPRLTPESWANAQLTPNQLRWSPLPEGEAVDFIDSLLPFACHGQNTQEGATVYLYQFTESMGHRFFYSADGEWLFVPQQGVLTIETECGPMVVSPGEIAVCPRGMKWQVNPQDDRCSGYVLENHGARFTLPELGPIGANGLANPRDFLVPTASYWRDRGSYQLVAKFGHQLWTAQMTHHPLNVVGWHGNLYPYKYDLTLFQALGSTSYDHPDPSLFTVLTSPSAEPGVANIDFVLFKSRWLVAENTFRPPYFHRNVMSEFMGLIFGQYDAKAAGFQPGGASLHNAFSAHGPDAETVNKAEVAELAPHYLDDTLAFMFESRQPWRPTRWALEAATLQSDYASCWQGINSRLS